MKKLSIKLLCFILAFATLFSMTAFVGSAGISTVKNVSLVEVDDDEIEIKWGSVSGASGYEVYMKHSNGSWVYKVSVSKNRAEIEHLISGSVYSFKVRAYKRTLSGKTYGSFSSAFKTATEPDEVNNLTSTSLSSGKTTLKWSKVTGATAYQIYKYNKSLYSWSKVKSLTSTSCKISASSGDKFKVRALKKVNGKYYYGDFSSVAVVGLSVIGAAKAKSIALKNAGYSESQVRDLEVQLEKTRSGYIYEVDFEVGYYEYEYEINASTGKIIHKEIDR